MILVLADNAVGCYQRLLRAEKLPAIPLAESHGLERPRRNRSGVLE
jgi:hypothetical protein